MNTRLLSFVVLFFLLSGITLPISAIIKNENQNSYYSGYNLYSSNEPFEGYTLFSPEYSKKTFLIDINGDIVHNWDSNYTTRNFYSIENFCFLIA